MTLPTTRVKLTFWLIGLATVAAAHSDLNLAEDTKRLSTEQLEFFENRVRPALVKYCYACHNSAKQQEGGLAVDHRSALSKGGDSGPSLKPGDPKRSLLVQRITSEDADERMPQDGPTLPQNVVADLIKWVEMGAPDPRDAAPSAADIAEATSWPATLERRKQWWSFQPLTPPAVPPTVQAEWSAHAVDRFLLAKSESAGLRPVDAADPQTLVRRLYFTLTGLPPTPEATAKWTIRLTAPQDETTGNNIDQQELARLVDELLESPHFGERWARHWMDWMRYAESHGSEGDPAIANAWRYRDYLIRALNEDVPYDQLVREHLAGDLLAQPRINEESGLNESVLGTAHYRFVQHGFAPTDALDEQVRFTDNQIDVISKAFLGVTVSCARCHNHKFDPLSQTDFYALYGIMASCRPAMVTVDSPTRQVLHKDRLQAIKTQLREKLADAWLAHLPQLERQLAKANDEKLSTLAAKAENSEQHPLYVWNRLRSVTEPRFAEHWQRVKHDYQASADRLRQRRETDYPRRWHLGGADGKQWYHHGVGLDGKPAPAGAFTLREQGDQVIGEILPAGVYSHLLTSKHNGVLMSPRFPVDVKQIYIRVAGDGDARARYVVQHYPRRGTVYPLQTLQGGQARWIRWDMTYWQGDHAHLEVTTAADQAVELNAGAARSWFGVTEVLMLDEQQAASGKAPRDEMAEFVALLFDHEDNPADLGQLAAWYRRSIAATIVAWKTGKMSDAQARFLSACVREGLLPNTLQGLPTVAELVREYRQFEQQIPVPTRAPGILEGSPLDQPLFIRGDHKQPGDPVKRRFLEAIDAQPYETHNSGRLNLANSILDNQNPLTSRVIVNRIWHHVFGQGIVATPDNFGRLGQAPSHPELLDYLARQFQDQGWSLKQLIRQLVTSRTFQLSSRPSKASREIDPDNRLLTHMSVRRLEAEAIRDAMLAAAGTLDLAMYGPPQAGNSLRRSIYLQLRRNSVDPFLATFDFPVPFSTKGRRDVTNVPAQSLLLMNDAFVTEQARRFAARTGKEKESSFGTRLEAMFANALGRLPSEDEVEQLRRYASGTSEAQLAAIKHRRELNEQLAGTLREIDALITPVRQRLLAAKTDKPAGEKSDLRPIASWDFSDSLRDQIGQLHGIAKGDAKLAGGALHVGGNGHVLTPTLKQELRTKTLEAWVTLDNLEQRGGGVMSIQTPGGEEFDAIVFGEQEPQKWMAGSAYFRRTKSFQGDAEQAATKDPVQIAIVYHADGKIAGYRNGQLYGMAYTSGGPVQYKAGQTVISFGLRHLPATGGRMLKGRIHKARLYDRALTAEEVAASARGDARFVTERELIAALTTGQRERKSQLERQRLQLEQQLAALGPAEPELNANDLVWQDIALAIFNFKEFIFLR